MIPIHNYIDLRIVIKTRPGQLYPWRWMGHFRHKFQNGFNDKGGESTCLTFFLTCCRCLLWSLQTSISWHRCKIIEFVLIVCKVEYRQHFVRLILCDLSTHRGLGHTRFKHFISKTISFEKVITWSQLSDWIKDRRLFQNKNVKTFLCLESGCILNKIMKSADYNFDNYLL